MYYRVSKEFIEGQPVWFAGHDPNDARALYSIYENEAYRFTTRGPADTVARNIGGKVKRRIELTDLV
jgi:hypothetical protein